MSESSKPTQYPATEARKILGELVKRAAKGEQITISYRDDFHAVLADPAVVHAGLIATGRIGQDMSDERRDLMVNILGSMSKIEREKLAGRERLDRERMAEMGLDPDKEYTEAEVWEVEQAYMKRRRAERQERDE
ncbi:hypothetical protein [Glycomyces buryatensis]|uniref:Uncharacterized protein n=1 Tax=Glycomyces buryatensis TaxID=2570927 RepID=A0A4S8Q5S3_9ACTN|nr:hypothetical protein [Glycomyces buryatensis]THV39657.1 hypothetical protein FAB82_17465 [Glycomyces buryatensis]